MTQRNPLNERYTTDQHHGTTRKSAASAKPKAKAAASVRIQPAEKTPEQKKAERKAQRKEERAKQAELDNKYYNPPTDRYKKLRRLWWVLLISAIICTIAAFAGRSTFPAVALYIILAGAYIFCIAAIILDCTAIKKERKNYQEMMEAQNAKANRAEEKAQKAAAREKAKEEKEREAAVAAGASPEGGPGMSVWPEEEQPKKKRFGSRKKKEAEAAEAAGAVKVSDAAAQEAAAAPALAAAGADAGAAAEAGSKGKKGKAGK